MRNACLEYLGYAMETVQLLFTAICLGVVWAASVTIYMALMGAVVAMIMLTGGGIYLTTRLSRFIEKYGFLRG